MPYVLAAAAAFFLLMQWRTRQGRGQAAPIGPFMRSGTPPDRFDARRSPAEVDASLSLALKRLLPVVTGLGVRANVAVRPGLLVPMAAGDLADLLEELLAAAVHQAAGCRLVVTGTAHGGQVHIGVTDDAGGADPQARAASVERLAERAALRGGALDIEVRPAEGTTMTLRLAAAAGRVGAAPDDDAVSGRSARRAGDPGPAALDVA